MDDEAGQNHHATLQSLRASLQRIYKAILDYQPAADTPPILDSSIDMGAGEGGDDGQFVQNEGVTGLGKLRDAMKMDLDNLGKFLDNSFAAHLPPLTTNAPYLIAIWKEFLCAPPPVEAIFKSMPLEGPSRQKATQRPASTKVDIVADFGRRWIRVNTVKNSRLLAEFREIDSYLTDSDNSSADDSPDARPSLAQTEFDNSVLRMGRSLLEAAKANPLEGVGVIPQVTLRLTRLDPSGEHTDPRIGNTIQLLEEMGITVELGERQGLELSVREAPLPDTPVVLEPTLNINIDLSVLIAVISDTAHAPLPHSLEDAKKRHIPPPEYREWKQRRKTDIKSSDTPAREYEDIDDLPRDLRKQARALTNQLLREMGRGLLQEMRDRISAITSENPLATVRFWTTPEVRDRSLRIIAKIGGAAEKRRAHALFSSVSQLSPQVLSDPEAEEAFWRHSRHPPRFLPLFPINIFPPASTPDSSLPEFAHLKLPLSRFSRVLAKTCRDILEQETMPHPRALPDELTTDSQALYDAVEIQRAIVTKANPRLTAHTVQSLLWGAELGWTTVTANRTSVKAILREIRLARVTGRLEDLLVEDGSGDGLDSPAGTEDCRAAIWFVDPRSLAEGMSSLNHE